jgi:hypothetical protein
MLSTFAALRFPRILLALAILPACGAPGSDAVFTKGNPRIPAVDSGKAVVAQPSVPRVQPRQYGGYYRRLGGDSRFQPCGTAAPLEITGTLEARVLLQERFRWNSFEQGRKMFGVFQGVIVTDTIKPPGSKADSAAGTPRTRFFITRVDSLRTWQDSDCGGMRIS